MAAYGEERLTVGRHVAGRVAVTGVTAVVALAPRLRFGLSWTLGHLVGREPERPRGGYRLVGYDGELWLGGDDIFVGRLVRDGSRHEFHSLGHVDAQVGSVALDLGWHRLERLEEHRAGGPLTVRMKLWPRIEMDGGRADARIKDIQIQVPRDDWIAALGALTGEQIDLLEIRYHLVYAAHYRPSLKELDLARDAVDRGDFNRAVLQARKAVTLMEESVKAATGEDLKAALTDRIDKRHADLYGGIVTRAKDMGNITAHRAEAREYTRVEALFAIRLATITLEVVAGLLSS